MTPVVLEAIQAIDELLGKVTHYGEPIGVIRALVKSLLDHGEGRVTEAQVKDEIGKLKSAIAAGDLAADQALAKKFPRE